MENPVLIGAVRTAIGRFQGTLSSLKATELGAAVVREAVKRSKVSPDAVDEVLPLHSFPSALRAAVVEEQCSERDTPAVLLKPAGIEG